MAGCRALAPALRAAYHAGMRIALLFVALALTACASRPLTPSEVALLGPLHGPTLDTRAVRIARAPVVGIFPITYDARPRTTCRERISPPLTGRITVQTGGITLFNRLFLSGEAWRGDYAADAPLALGDAMFIAHEATHVWQWQQRRLTGYHPVKAFTEQVTEDDPYLLDPLTRRPFLDHGYEQQASLVEEYLCCATLDPGGQRTTRLHDLLRQVMPVAEPAAFAREVTVPYSDDLDGICD